ncbi:hypothetical protein EB1_35160 [Empedobacter brevis NBRC 14943 = ATCC 43319]|uniref:DUF4365 domain-containing protein n=1 Tax=Empedobacter brevis NBRC 14943 = ATCC 43319 TaxID=1218108 RepID=A0A511NLV3_9FLAO|nr:DUF4365 domain-containing protein [Empedobacter brevis]GEM53726.1 hypothetical protein EB1_35160 [Empedobacter brevis NBRC 14943 = ATCC 43319]
MIRKKQRVLQHVMEDESYEIIKCQIPKHWVIREFNRPDYGIDLVIELFELIDEDVAETLGEFIYVQVKSVKELQLKQEIIYEVGNVAKGIWNENRKSYTKLDVIKYPFDTTSIFTFQSLGGSVPVLLFVVDIKNRETYFVCVNDYIDKIILPQNPKYTEQGSVTFNIPSLNKLSNPDIANNALKFYGKRAKLLAAFSKFSFQKNEIKHIFGYKDYPVWTYRDEIEKDKVYQPYEIKTQILYFISQIEDLDIWQHNEWQVLPQAKFDLIQVKTILENDEIDWRIAKDKIIVLWHQLTNLGTMYEDICREWFLPKMISLMTSYPTMPEIIDEK